MPTKRRMPEGPREAKLETTPRYLGPATKTPTRRPARPRRRPPEDEVLLRIDFKLRESRFFLSQLEFVAAEPSAKLDPESFAFHFSAFISAAISVTYVLRDQPWFRSWVEALPEERDRELMTEMELQRGAEIHAQGAALKRGTRMVEQSWTDRIRAEHIGGQFLRPGRVALFSMMLNQPAPILTARAPGKQHPPALGGFTSYIEHFDFGIELVEGRPENALELCRRLLALLERLVADFKARGPKK
jgi:hypothetical protein